MEQWKLTLTSNGEDLGKVDVKRGMFHGDSLSRLLCFFFESGTFVIDT